jgi:D-amino-acid oxidase
MPAIDRRSFLALGFTMTGCATRRVHIAPPVSHAFKPVLVAEDRIIRTVTGLRPYRPSGFVVRKDSIGLKTVVHNYGHGGGGMTLSWGTSHLAVEMTGPVAESSVAVLGCGGVGLATARLLQRRGARVTIYAKALPPETTSNIAGAQWWPTSVFDMDQSTPEFRQQFIRAAELSYREYQHLPGDRYGIRWVRNYIVREDQPIGDQFILGPTSPINHLYPEYADLPENATPFGRYARRFTTMMIEPPVYLNALMQDFHMAGGRIVARAFESLDQIQSLPESLIVNCTGLGAGALFGDKELVPVKGQLTVLLPQPEVNYNLLAGGVYMFPRRDGILLGGTWDRGNFDLAPDLDAQKRILARHKELFARA